MIVPVNNIYAVFGGVRSVAEHNAWMDEMRKTFGTDESMKETLALLDERGSIPMQVAVLQDEEFSLARFIPEPWGGKYMERRMSSKEYFDLCDVAPDKRPFSHFALFVGGEDKPDTRFPLMFGRHVVKSQYALCGWDQKTMKHTLLHCAQCCTQIVQWIGEMQGVWKEADLPPLVKEPTHVATKRLQ